MKTLILATLLLVGNMSFAKLCDVQTITQNYCNTIDWADVENSSECPVEIKDVVFKTIYEVGKSLEFYQTPVQFAKSGELYEIIGNYMGGTGIDIVLVDPKSCAILDQTNVYSE